MGFCIAWLYGLWCLGLGGASNSSLVKVNENPSSREQSCSCWRFHLFAASGLGASSSFCVSHSTPVMGTAEGISRDVKRQLGGRKTLGAIWYLWQAAAPLQWPSPGLWLEAILSPKSICACHQWEWLQSGAILIQTGVLIL